MIQEGISSSKFGGVIHYVKRPPTPLVPPSTYLWEKTRGVVTRCSDILLATAIHLTTCIHWAWWHDASLSQSPNRADQTTEHTHCRTVGWIHATLVPRARFSSGHRYANTWSTSTVLMKSGRRAWIVLPLSIAKLSPVLSWALVASSLSSASCVRSLRRTSRLRYATPPGHMLFTSFARDLSMSLGSPKLTLLASYAKLTASGPPSLS